MIDNASQFSDLYKYALVTWDRVESLAALAEPELWTPPSAPHRANLWLKQYLNICFGLATKQNLVAEVVWPDRRVCFHTGLRCRTTGNAIYGLFEPNRIPHRQPWFLKGYFEQSHPSLRMFPQLPGMPRTWTDLTDLAFDSSQEWIPEVSHIAAPERISRLGPELGALNPYLRLSTLAGSILISRQLCLAGKAEVIPQHYRGTMGFFAPLWLAPGQARYVIVLEVRGDYYRIPTVLPIEWAYPYARVVGRPHGWLEMTQPRVERS